MEKPPKRPRPAPSYQIGQAVVYARECAVGLVVETEAPPSQLSAHRPGLSVLLHDGHLLAGLSAEQADECLRVVGETGLDYDFHDAGTVQRDYQGGQFDEAFSLAWVCALMQQAGCIEWMQQWAIRSKS